MSDLSNTQLGQYELLEPVGHGGTATVYKAYQSSLDRFVAVKVLLSGRNSQFAVRFKREARAIAALQHHNILPVYDYGERDGLLYLVLQYVEHGTTLADALRHPIAAHQVLRLISHVLDALDYAHKRGIIHRDIKPTNVLMPSPRWPMLTDFGIAKLMNDNQHLTMAGSIIGTAVYMAPEQATGQPIDARTDLYAAGVVLYQLLTGRPPFDGDTPMAVLTKHVYDQPPPPRRINLHLPQEAEAVLLRALAKDPAQRYQSAAEMAADIESVANRIDRDPKLVQMTGLYLAGVQAIEIGHWDEAIDQLSKLVARDPEYEDAGELLEAARAEQERIKAEARQQAEQARGQRASAPQPAEQAANQQLNKVGESVLVSRSASAASGACRRCGHVVRATAKWCPSCGAPLPVISINTTVSTEAVRPSPAVVLEKPSAPPVSSDTITEPYLNTRFEGVGLFEALPVDRAVSFIVWVGPQLMNNQQESSRPFRAVFSDPAQPTRFTVHVHGDPENWIISIIEPTLVVTPPGRTLQEAEFLITARKPGRDKLHIVVEQADTHAEVQHVFLPVTATVENQQEQDSRARRSISWLQHWLARALKRDVLPSKPNAGIRPATVPEGETSQAAMQPQAYEQAGSQPSSLSKVHHPAVAAKQFAVPPRAPSVSHASHTNFGSRVSTLIPSRESASAFVKKSGGDVRREASVPFSANGMKRRAVRMSISEGHDANSFRMEVRADLPNETVHAFCAVPLNAMAVQNATIRLRQELERVVFHGVDVQRQKLYPFANDTTLTVDPQVARKAVLPLADAGRQVWDMLFNAPRTPEELKRIAQDIRRLPPGSTLQIVLDSQQFIVPWALLYDRPGHITEESLDWAGFWGYRYILDVLPPRRYPEPVIRESPLGVQLLFHDDEQLRRYTVPLEQFVRDELGDTEMQAAWGSAEVKEALSKESEAQLLYLYCHGIHVSGATETGKLPSESALMFSRNERLRLADLRRIPPHVLRRQPLVFLNACEGATQDAFYYDGFMPFFIEEQGARGFIGTEVKAPQLFAHEFALAFLQGFARGQPVGEILWRLRREYLDTHQNILGFNYSLYGLDEIHLDPPLISPEA